MGYYVYSLVLIIHHLMLILSSFNVLAQYHPSDHRQRKTRILQSDNSSAPANDDTHKKSSSFGAATMFLLFDFVGLAAVILLFFLYYKKDKALKKLEKKLEKMMKKEYNIEEAKDEDDDEIDDEDSEEFRVRKRAQQVSAERSRLSFSKDHAEERSRLSVSKNHTEERSRLNVPKNGDERENKLVFMGNESETFELNDLLKASAEGLGKGVFGNSYKAKLEGKSAYVVKRLKNLRPLSNEEFIKQLQMISELSHPNLLPLLAYYYSKDEKLFVYKYADKGNLFNRLHG